MKAREQMNQRAVLALDRLAWGWADLRRIWAERGGWPARSLVLVGAGGHRLAITGTRLRPMAAGATPQGQLMAQGDCLWGSLDLPGMPRRELPQAVDEALWRVSPLPPEQVLCAWHAMPAAQAGWRVQWGICRRDVQQAQRESSGLTAQAPVFFESGPGRALPVRTPSLAAPRGQRQARAVQAMLMLLVLAALLAPVFLPLALKRQAVVRAMAHVQGSESQAAPLRAQLDELRTQADLAEKLRVADQTRLPLASVVELLSAAVPDAAWLERIEVNGLSIRLVGVADNAGEIMAQLARQPRLADVRASAASVRDNTLGKERFTLEMRWRDAPEAKP